MRRKAFHFSLAPFESPFPFHFLAIPFLTLLALFFSGCSGGKFQSSSSEDGASATKISIDQTQLTLTEGGAAVLALVLDKGPSRDLELEISVNDPNSRFQALNSTITIPKDSTSKTLTFQTIDDSLYQGTDVVSVSISSQDQKIKLLDSTIEMTVYDNESAPTVAFLSASQTVAEAVISKSVTVALSGGIAQSVTVPITVSGTAVNGVNYANMPTQITFPSGVTSRSLTFDQLDDGASTAPLTIILTLGTPSEFATVGAQASHTITLSDNGAGVPSSILVSSGNNQSGVVNASLGSPFTAVVRDALGDPVAGEVVSWTVLSGGGSLSSASTTTDASGFASTTLTLGTGTGPQSVRASIVSGAHTVDFAATATPGALSTFEFTAIPTGATAGSSFNFTVRAKDSFGNRKTDFTDTVQFSTSDSNSPTLPSDYTFVSGDTGQKTFSATLTSSGAQTITVSLTPGGSPSVTSGTVTVIAATATKLYLATQPANRASAATLPTVTVHALDSYNNLDTSFASQIQIAFGTNAGSGILSGTTSVIGTLGASSFSDLSVDKVGTGYTLTASATGLTSVTSSTFNITPGAPASISKTSGDNQTAQTSTALSAFEVQVLDAAANVVPSVTVNWTKSVNAGTLSSASNSTNSTGNSQSTLTLGSVAGAHTVTATVNGTAIAASFAATAYLPLQISPSAFYLGYNSTKTFTTVGGLGPYSFSIPSADLGSSIHPSTGALSTSNQAGQITVRVTDSTTATSDATVTIFDISTVTDLKIWLKADALSLSDNDLVSTWTDSSGLGNNATAAGVARPTFKANVFGTRPAVRFDGTNTFLATSLIPVTGTGARTSALVIRNAVAANTKTTHGSTGLFFWGSNYWYGNLYEFTLEHNTGYGMGGGLGFNLHGCCGYAANFVAPSQAIGNSSIIVTDFDGTNQRIYVNGVQSGVTQGALGLNTDSGSTLQIGHGYLANRKFQGDISEFMIAATALSTSDRKALECVWGNKYGISVGNGNECGEALQIFPSTNIVLQTSTSATFSTNGKIGSVRFSVTGAGSVNPISGLYTAPATSTVDTVTATDSAGQTSSVQVKVVEFKSPRVWVAADELTGFSDGDSVHKWPDLTGNGFDLSRTDSVAARPIYKTNVIGSLPAVRFDGTTTKFLNSWYRSPSGTADRSFIFVTANLLAGSTLVKIGPAYACADAFNVFLNGSSFVGILQNCNSPTTTTNAVSTSATVISVVRSSNTTTVYVNGNSAGALATAGSTDTSFTSVIATGISLGYGMSGDLAEFLAYDEGLDETSRLELETYLKSKYGIP